MAVSAAVRRRAASSAGNAAPSSAIGIERQKPTLKSLLVVDFVLPISKCSMIGIYPDLAGTSIGRMYAPIQIRIFHALSVLFIFASLGACGEPSVRHRLELSDESGTVVATLAVTLPSSLPASGQDFEGSWELQSHTGAFPIGAVHPGHYYGFQQDGKLLLDLNPRWADNNVVLEAAAQTKQMAGRWRLATAAGFQPGGSFRAAR